jgi:hypothetical protein
VEREAQLRRDVNEYIYDVLTRLDGDGSAQVMHAICECDRPCARIVELDVATYLEIRSADGWRIISPDHDGESCGEIVRRSATYRVAITQPA